METDTFRKGEKAFLHNLTVSGLPNATIISCQVRTSELFTRIISNKEVAVFGDYDVIICYSIIYKRNKQIYKTKIVNKTFCEIVPYKEEVNTEPDNNQELRLKAMFPTQPTCKCSFANSNGFVYLKGNAVLKIEVHGDIKVIQNTVKNSIRNLHSQEAENLLSGEQLYNSVNNKEETEQSQAFQFNEKNHIPIEDLLEMDGETLKIMAEKDKQTNIIFADEIQTNKELKKCEMDNHLVDQQSYELQNANRNFEEVREGKEIEQWRQGPLSEVYTIVFIDSMNFSVRENNFIRKLEAYVVLGINDEGKKEVLTIQVLEDESCKCWSGIFQDLKKRGVKDILILCADELTGLKESMNAAFPKTEYQKCIVHQIRNALKYVPNKDKRNFIRDLKSIYQAANEEQGKENMKEVIKKWQDKYPNFMKGWKVNWDSISPIYKFSSEVRKAIYTINTIENLNSTYRRLNAQKRVFPSKAVLLKDLYLTTFEVTKKWTATLRNWGNVYGELSIMYEGRFPQ